MRKILFSIKETNFKNWNTSYLSPLPFGQSHHHTPLGHCGPWVTVAVPLRLLCFFASFSKLTSLRHSVCVHRKPTTSLPVEYHPMSSLIKSKPRGFSRPGTAILSGSLFTTRARSAEEGNQYLATYSKLPLLFQVFPQMSSSASSS